MALKTLLTDLGSFYNDNPYQQQYKYGGGPAYVVKKPFLARSLKFGNDTPGNGNSGQPFIVKKLPDVTSGPTSQFPDFLLRDPKNALDTRKDDLERITKFLRTPQGNLFIAKQQLLSLQNPIVPGRPNRANAVSGQYNPAMTLMQVAGAGTGLHVEKQGLLPIFNNRSKYATVYKNEFNSPQTNRLVILRATKIGDPTSNLDIPQPIPNKPNLTFGQPRAVGVSRNPNLVLSYLGGPEGIFGGTTNTKFADNRVYGGNIELKTQNALRKREIQYNYNRYLGVTNKGLELGYFADTVTSLKEVKGQQWNANNNSITVQGNSTRNNTIYNTGFTFPDTNGTLTNYQGVYTFRQSDFQKVVPIGRYGSTTVTDFRKTVADDPTQIGPNGKSAKTQLLYTDYAATNINRETRVGLGNPGKRTRNRGVLTSYDSSTVDRINMIPLYSGSAVQDPDGLSRDLIKFRFEVISNVTPVISTYVHFRAFLGTITDGFTADWESIRYVGRGEKLYNYTGFSRNVSFNFRVAPQSRAEMKPLYQKLNYLATTLAPDYTNGYMKGNLIKLTIGDYLYQVPGILTSLTYTIPEEASWEIALTEPENGADTGLLETPKLFDVNVSFTPIHNFVPRIGAGKDTALITRQIGANPYLDDTTIINGPAINSSNLLPYATKGSV